MKDQWEKSGFEYTDEIERQKEFELADRYFKDPENAGIVKFSRKLNNLKHSYLKLPNGTIVAIASNEAAKVLGQGSFGRVKNAMFAKGDRCVLKIETGHDPSSQEAQIATDVNLMVGEKAHRPGLQAQHHTATDCISTANASPSTGVLLNNLIYNNIGVFFNQGMALAVSTCAGGYSNAMCTCSFQHAYVICELTDLLVANGFTSADIPTWLINPHCNETSDELITHGNFMEQLPQHTTPSHCATSIQNFFNVKENTACQPPW